MAIADLDNEDEPKTLGRNARSSSEKEILLQRCFFQSLANYGVTLL